MENAKRSSIKTSKSKLINDDIHSSLKVQDLEARRQHDLKRIRKYEGQKQNGKGLHVIQDKFETFGK